MMLLPWAFRRLPVMVLSGVACQCYADKTSVRLQFCNPSCQSLDGEYVAAFLLSHQVSKMRSVTSFLLAILVAMFFVLSLISFIWWLVFVYNIVIGDTAVELGMRFATSLTAQISPQQILLMKAREYLVFIGGAVGWSAFLALPHFSSRPFHTLPKLLLASCAIGITAAIVMPAASLFKVAPILAVILTLVRCSLISSASPNGVAQGDTES